MSWQAGLVAGVLGAIAYLSICRMRPQSFKVLLEDLQNLDFSEEKSPWFLKALILKPVLLLKNCRYRIWYFRTVGGKGEIRESAAIYRFLFAPLHVFYIGGEPTNVKGGFVKFEVLEDENLSKENLRKILKVLRAKHQKKYVYGAPVSLN